MSTWSTVEVLPLLVRYETPKFERAAQRASSSGYLASSPRQGRLLKLLVNRHPNFIKDSTVADRWLRFVLDDYQLALRLGEAEGIPPGIHRHPNAVGWIWPYVSRRAPGREMISLWSSHNEVGILGGPDKFASALRQAVNASNARSFEAELGDYLALLTWDIPRPPYRRLLEWQHLQ
jgi:hypothetical protein